MIEEQLKKEWLESVGTEDAFFDLEGNAALLRRLRKPEGRIDAVLDTDTYNEIDDQYALAYMINSDEKINLKAVYATPFTNCKSDGPADGMEKSYEEILHILRLMNREDLKERVFRGSREYLPDEKTPVVSEAAKNLADRAMGYTRENPLCDYLADFTEQEALACGGGRTWSRPIWDVAAVVAAGRRSDERPDRICAAPGV